MAAAFSHPRHCQGDFVVSPTKSSVATAIATAATSVHHHVHAHPQDGQMAQDIRRDQTVPGVLCSDIPGIENASGMENIRKNLTCGLCKDLVASSLVLSCGHMFCGACLFDFVNEKPSCPTCQVGLRAVPVRCLAIDGVIEAYHKLSPKTEQTKHLARIEEGKSAANKLNKMLWWLQPAAIPALGESANHAAAAPAPVLGSILSNRPSTGFPARQQFPRHSLDDYSHGSLSFTSGSSRPMHQQGLTIDGHGSNSFTSGSTRHQPGQHMFPPQIPRQSVPGGFGNFGAAGMQQQQQAHNMQNMENLCQLAALGMPAMQQQQQLPYVDYQAANCQSANANSQFANLQAQMQLQQLLQSLYMS